MTGTGCDREVFARMTGCEPVERTFENGARALWAFQGAGKITAAIRHLDGGWTGSITTPTHDGYGEGSTAEEAVGVALETMRRTK